MSEAQNQQHDESNKLSVIFFLVSVFVFFTINVNNKNKYISSIWEMVKALGAIRIIIDIAFLLNNFPQQFYTLARNLTPNDFIWDVVLQMSIIGLGHFFFALFAENIQNFLQGRGRRRLEMELRRHVEKWMIHHFLPEDLKGRVREAVHYNWYTTRGVSAEMVLEHLSEDLAIKIQHFIANAG